MRRIVVAVVLLTIGAGSAVSSAEGKTPTRYYEVEVRITSDTEWLLDGRTKCGGYPESAFPRDDLGYRDYFHDGKQDAFFFNSRPGIPKPLPVRVYGTPGRLHLDPMGEGHTYMAVDQRVFKGARLDGLGKREWNYTSEDTAGPDGSCPPPSSTHDPRTCGSRTFDGDFALVPKGLDGLQVRSRPATMFADGDPWAEPESGRFCMTGSPYQATLLALTGKRRRLAQDLVLEGRKRVQVVASNKGNPLVQTGGYDLPYGSYQHQKATTVVTATVAFVRTTRRKALELAKSWRGPPIRISERSFSELLQRSEVSSHQILEVELSAQDASLAGFHRSTLTISRSLGGNRALGRMAAATSPVGSGRFKIVNDSGERAVARIKLSTSFFEDLQRTGEQQVVGTLEYRSQGAPRKVSAPFTMRAPD